MLRIFRITTKNGARLMMAVLVLAVVTMTPLWSAVRADDTSTPPDTSGIKSDIADVQKKLDQAMRKKAVLEQNLSQINQSLARTLGSIKQTQNTLQETTDVIARKQLEIQLLDQQIDLKTEVLAELMRTMYFTGQNPELNAMLGDESFSTVMDAGTNVATMEQKVQGLLDDIQTTQDKTAEEKANLEALKQQHEATLAATLTQKQQLAAAQADTAENVAQAAATVAELQQKLAKLNSDLSGLLGQVVSTSDVTQAAKIAGAATGVRPAFILGELTQESGLGRFTGGCYYKNTRVKPADTAAFKSIMGDLGYNINSKKISCSASYGYGGAMGIAQFMPTTWLGYESKISAMTGHKPPDPWSVTDGVVGMAIKLANGGAASKGGEYAASMLYYCGTTHPSNPTIKKACNNYAANVQRLASGYEKDN